MASVGTNQADELFNPSSVIYFSVTFMYPVELVISVIHKNGILLP